MALNVDLGELVSVAGQSADTARVTGAAMPREWVLPAGTDPISAQAVPQLNSQAAALFNATIGVLNKIQRDAHLVGQAAADYSATDDEGARLINGSGAELVGNPVPAVEQVGLRRVPPGLSTMPVVTGDPLTFAQQLQNGPGAGPAFRFADSIRLFNTSSRTQASGDMDRAGAVLQHWAPVGSDVAQRFATYRGWMDHLGDAMEKLAQGAESYGNAFTRVKAKHPTPEEIRAARKRMLAAARSKNEAALAAATAEYNELNMRAGEATGSYVSETGTGVASSEAGAASSQAATGGQQSGSGDQMLSQMLPTLMSMMGLGANGLSQNEDISDEYYDDYYDDYGLGDYAVPSFPSTSSGGSPSMPGGGVPSVSDVQTLSATTTMPLAGAVTGANVGSAPRVPVGDAMAGGAGGQGARTAGSPMMPYAPMGPGMGGAGGGAGGNERNRVVAWHPDRLMYVDDTPHTEPVIGERPTIAPTVTQPTPAPANQAPTRSGGNV